MCGAEGDGTGTGAAGGRMGPRGEKDVLCGAVGWLVSGNSYGMCWIVGCANVGPAS